MSFWQNAPGYATATPPNSRLACTDALLSTLCPAAALTLAVDTPCWRILYDYPEGAGVRSTSSAFRVDQKLGNSDNIFGRYKMDHGLQPTRSDPIQPMFDANSNQPAWDAQAQETHIFSPAMTNQFTATLSHYVAQFLTGDRGFHFNYAQAFSEASDPYNFTSPNAGAASFPQGRNITQYQFIDDFSWTHGNHTFKFGENFRRYDISDHNFFFNSPVVYWGYVPPHLQQFAAGRGIPVPQGI